LLEIPYDFSWRSIVNSFFRGRFRVNQLSKGEVWRKPQFVGLLESLFFADQWATEPTGVSLET